MQGKFMILGNVITKESALEFSRGDTIIILEGNISFKEK
jgi:hypothetical protein